MIPPDVASNLRQILPDAQSSAQSLRTAPVPNAQRIADALSDLVPGQRIMAEIQALLPNGSYRALVAQRDITLALPFSAKPGDTLELEVREADGAITLAYVGNKEGAEQEESNQSASTSLSNTGKLIGTLLENIADNGKRAAPVPLNQSQPLVESMPASSAELAPVLKQAIAQSGVFYEAHQAQWVNGRLPTAQLLAEPQGKYSNLAIISRAQTPPSVALPLPPVNVAPEQAPQMASLQQLQAAAASVLTEAAPPIQHPSLQLYLDTQPKPPMQPAGEIPPQPPIAEMASPAIAASSDRPADDIPQPLLTRTGTPTDFPSPAQHAITDGSRPIQTSLPGAPGTLPPDLTPIVQQQLDGLATQTYAWQGQIWPGQQMHWEIEQGQKERGKPADEPSQQWRTKLKLVLPTLGGIETTIQLRPGDQFEIAIQAEDQATEARLREAGVQLLESFARSALTLTNFEVKHAEE